MSLTSNNTIQIGIVGEGLRATACTGTRSTRSEDHLAYKAKIIEGGLIWSIVISFRERLGSLTVCDVV
jgi:hypothetical protein